jgi:hypothetical protein
VIKTVERDGKLFFALVKQIAEEIPKDISKTNAAGSNTEHKVSYPSISEEESVIEEAEREGFIYW